MGKWGLHQTKNLYTVLVRVSSAGKRHHDYSNSYKGKRLIGACLHFRALVHCRGRKRDRTQTDILGTAGREVLILA